MKKKRLLLIFSLMSALAIALTGVVAAEQHEPPEPDEPPAEPGEPIEPVGDDKAVVVMDEMEGSGYRGIAVLHGDMDQTDVVAVVLETDVAIDGNGIPNGNGLPNGNGDGNGILNGNGQELGPVAILDGTCEDPGETVEEIGELQAINGAHAVSGTVPMSLDELLTGDFIIAVLAANDVVDEPEPFAPENGVGEPEPGGPNGNGGNPVHENGLDDTNGQNLLACGELTEDARLDAVEEPFEPGAPEPGVPDAPDTPNGEPAPGI